MPIIQVGTDPSSGPVRASTRVLLAAALLALAPSCQTIRYTTGQSGGGGRIEQKAPFFLWGLVGEKEIQMGELCPRGPARWYSQQTFWDGAFEVTTLGIYSPRTIVVECGNGAVYHLAPEASGQFQSSLTENPDSRK
jgi:hypothetical protein